MHGDVCVCEWVSVNLKRETKCSDECKSELLRYHGNWANPSEGGHVSRAAVGELERLYSLPNMCP